MSPPLTCSACRRRCCCCPRSEHPWSGGSSHSSAPSASSPLLSSVLPPPLAPHLPPPLLPLFRLLVLRAQATDVIVTSSTAPNHFGGDVTSAPKFRFIFQKPQKSQTFFKKTFLLAFSFIHLFSNGRMRQSRGILKRRHATNATFPAFPVCEN